MKNMKCFSGFNASEDFKTNEDYDDASIKKLKTLKSIKQFTKLKFLGKGGFGEVILA